MNANAKITATTPASTDSVQAVLAGATNSNRPARRWLTWLILSALAAGGAYYFWGQPTKSTPIRYVTSEVKTGDIRVTVTATGNLKPKNQVDIGTELSGTIDAVLVDANDEVKKGQKLAILNTNQLEDTITKAKATLASNQAKVTQASASIVQSQASVREAQAQFNRLQQLYEASGGRMPAKSDLDTAKATLDRAKADVDNNKAAELAAKAAVAEAKANLNSAQTNLGKAMITSPIKGVVLTRSVEPGQTVAASFSAPTLFTLAEDLGQMEVEVGVDEADVGKVKNGQKAEFTVDAWPGRKYPAEITRVSLGSTTTENIVTYVTVLAVQNQDLTLRPGMTATATIATDSRNNVLLVPNAALRFTPPAPEGASSTGERPADSSSSFVSKLMPRPPRMMNQPRQRPTSTPPNPEGMQRVWVLDNTNVPAPIEVKTGLTDGKMTEITSGQLQAGMRVITEASTGASSRGRS